MIADSKQHLFDIVLVHKLASYQKLIRFAKVEGFVYGDVTGIVFHMPFRAEKADKSWFEHVLYPFSDWIKSQSFVVKRRVYSRG